MGNYASSKWSKLLMCEWNAWTVVGPKALRLDMPEKHCCDMLGAIEFAKMLMEDVDTIYTVAGGKPDTSYHRKSDNKWEAWPAA